MHHPKADADARHIFRKKIEQYEMDGRDIVYIDESGFAVDQPRTHGYAARGQRCVGSHDWHAKGRINVIGALLAGLLLSVGLTEANVDADIFNLWLMRSGLRPFSPETVHWTVSETGFTPETAACGGSGDGSRHLSSPLRYQGGCRCRWTLPRIPARL